MKRRSPSWINSQEIFWERTHRETFVKLFLHTQARSFKDLDNFGNTERYIGVESLSSLACVSHHLSLTGVILGCHSHRIKPLGHAS